MTDENSPSHSFRRWPTVARVAAMAACLGTGALAQDDTEIDSVHRLTQAEQANLVQQIGGCWIVQPHFRNVTVEVSFSLSIRGEVIDNYVELEDVRGGDEVGQAAAYEAARTAIIRCEGRGYNLPEEKYEVWRDLRMSFDGRNGRQSE